MQQLKLRQFAPIYVIMGDEAYYIDKITDFLEENILTEDEKMMNQLVCYGKEASIPQIINEARQFPMMSQYRVVILKEAQSLDRKADLDLLESYVKQMPATTILVISYKYGKIDKRKAWLKNAEQLGVVWTAEKLYDNQVPPIITSMAHAIGLSIDAPATALLHEYVGNDLQKIESVLKKLEIIVGEKKRIGIEDIEKGTGITHEYTAFELADALAVRDEVRAMRIVQHITSAIQEIIPAIFTYFQNLLIYSMTPDKSRESACAAMKINPFFFGKYLDGAKNYQPRKVFEIIGILRKYDGMSKGIGCNNATDKELLTELVYKILH